ncbi:sporulation inhibitor of replication protein SirA [Lentibacillus sp. CBA3610]|uniref:sporulation inhibitor of replication protein SirA n=1 Tax=Lentibacillus sp. CBA3610 TaxID=2518176 RepID=UPI001594FA7F|nr:sporulation inhibitor of replication protein SirA [Lentibacillus sp. CBA3610]
MNHYAIYWIKEEFAHFFYYRSDVLYRFIKSYEYDQNREDLAMQFRYITIDIPEELLISRIMKYQPQQADTKVEANSVKIHENMRYISLHMEQKRINFRGDIIHDAEDLLFPALRSFQPYFFVVGDRPYDFGWISPVGMGKYKDRGGQVLYSYL